MSEPSPKPKLTPEQRAARSEALLRKARADIGLLRARAAKRVLTGAHNLLGGAGGMPAQPAYRSAQVTRLGGPLGPSGGAANRHLSPKVRQDLRAYSQHLYRNSTIYRVTLDRFVQMVGGEWRVQAQATDAAGPAAGAPVEAPSGADPAAPGSPADHAPPTAAERFNDAAETLFSAWAQRACDIAGTRSLNDLLDMVVRCGAIDGDAGLVLTADGRLQPWESEQLGGPAARRNLKPGQPEGIVLDAGGRIVAYRFARWRDDGLIDPTGYDEVPAADVIAWCHAPRPSQHRGEPMAASAFGDVEQVEDFDEATSVAAKLQAYMIAVRTVTDPESAAAMPGQSVDLGNGQSQFQQDWELGSFFNVGEGESIEQLECKHPGTQYREFIVTKLRKVAACFGLAVEQVWLDFTQTNFHSAKSAQAQMRRNVGAPMAWRERALRRIYRWRIARAIAAGELDPTGVENALDCRWLPPPMPKLDPLKETLAVKAALETNTTTLMDQADADNADWAERVRQRGRERRMEIAEGVVPPSATPQSNGLASIGQPGTGDPLAAEAAASDTPAGAGV